MLFFRHMTNRDVICIGASAGGLAPLTEILSRLPETLPAAVFVVLHMSPDNPSQLPQILDRAGRLKASAAVDGEEIQPGRVYVAVPDHHLLIERDRVRIVRGPRENRHRPSIDNLFRSAARFHGSHVIGVVLSGSLDDGTAGLIAIKVRGGVAVVQEPAEAFSSEMPRNAMRYLDVDHVKPAAKIGPLLGRLVGEPLETGQPPVPDEMVQETKIANLELSAVENASPRRQKLDRGAGVLAGGFRPGVTEAPKSGKIGEWQRSRRRIPTTRLRGGLPQNRRTKLQSPLLPEVSATRSS